MSIQFKRSTVSGVQPSSTNMYQGELAINLPDKKLFTMDNNNEIINIGFSKDEADSTYLPFTGGTIIGPLEISNSTPFIDFHFNYSTSDYTHRIIASDANTLKLIANITEVSGNLKVDGSFTAINISNTGTISTSGNITSNGTIKANTFRAAGGVPSGDAAVVGYSFDNNGDSGVFYENASTTSYGGTLTLRNDGTVCFTVTSSQAVIVPLLNAQGGIFTGVNPSSNTVYVSAGSIEMFGAQPFIDFHNNNTQTDYTSRIIAADSTTLQIISGNITLAGNVGVSGSVTASSGIVTSSNITASGSVQGSFLHSTGTVQADGSIISNGSLTLTGNSTNGVYMKNSSAGIISFYDSKDPDLGIYNYTLMQDNGAFTFNFSTTNTAFDLGTAKHTFDYNGNYTAAGQIHSTGNTIVGSSTIQTDGNIYMPWAGDWLSNVLAKKATAGNTSKLGALNGWGGDQYPSSSGVLYIMSSFDTAVAGYLNGTQVLLTSARDKYGTGWCSFTMPFSAGDLVQVRGAQTIYARYYQ